MSSLIYEELTYKIRGALFEVYFIVDEKIIVEIKAAKDITDEYRAQVQNYLKATGYKLALLVNFGHYPQIQIERIAN